MVRCEIAGLLEPERGDLVEHLALEWQRADDDVEAAHAVGDDDRAAPVAHVAVAHLALDASSERWEIGTLERARTLVPQELQVDAHLSVPLGVRPIVPILDDFARPRRLAARTPPCRLRASPYQTTPRGDPPGMGPRPDTVQRDRARSQEVARSTCSPSSSSLARTTIATRCS